MVGGCNGVVPFWTLEECQNSCQSSIGLDDLITHKKPIIKIDMLGREISKNKNFIITIYDDGSIEKAFILEE